MSRDLDAHAAVVAPDPQRDAAARLAVLDRVVEQVREDLLAGLGVGPGDARALRLQRDRELLLLEARAPVAEQRSPRAGATSIAASSRFVSRPSIFESSSRSATIADEPARVTVDHLEVGAPVGVGERGAAEQRLGEAADRGERRAQLVRGVGHEFAPHPLEPHQLRHVVQHGDGPRAGVAADRETHGVHAQRAVHGMHHFDRLGHRPVRVRGGLRAPPPARDGGSLRAPCVRAARRPRRRSRAGAGCRAGCAGPGRPPARPRPCRRAPPAAAPSPASRARRARGADRTFAGARPRSRRARRRIAAGAGSRDRRPRSRRPSAASPGSAAASCPRARLRSAAPRRSRSRPRRARRSAAARAAGRARREAGCRAARARRAGRPRRPRRAPVPPTWRPACDGSRSRIPGWRRAARPAGAPLTRRIDSRRRAPSRSGRPPLPASRAGASGGCRWCAP